MIVGGGYYFLLETLWRGYSHWTMFLLGAVCIALLYWLNIRLGRLNYPFRCIVGAAVITALEFAVGVAVNLIMKWNVWDYSDEAFNLMGQVCPSASLMWLMLCIPGFFCLGIVKRIFDEFGEIR